MVLSSSTICDIMCTIRDLNHTLYRLNPAAEFLPKYDWLTGRNVIKTATARPLSQNISEQEHLRFLSVQNGKSSL